MKNALLLAGAVALLTFSVVASAAVTPMHGHYKGALTPTKHVEFKVSGDHVVNFKIVRDEGTRIVTNPFFLRVAIHDGHFSWEERHRRVVGHWTDHDSVTGTIHDGPAVWHYQASLVR